MSRNIGVGWAAVLTVGLIASDLAAQESRPIDFDGVVVGARGGPRGPAGPGRDFNEVTRGAEKIEGLLHPLSQGASTSTRSSCPISSISRFSFP